MQPIFIEIRSIIELVFGYFIKSFVISVLNTDIFIYFYKSHYSMQYTYLKRVWTPRRKTGVVKWEFGWRERISGKRNQYFSMHQLSLRCCVCREIWRVSCAATRPAPACWASKASVCGSCVRSLRGCSTWSITALCTRQYRYLLKRIFTTIGSWESMLLQHIGNIRYWKHRGFIQSAHKWTSSHIREWDVVHRRSSILFIYFSS